MSDRYFRRVAQSRYDAKGTRRGGECGKSFRRRRWLATKKVSPRDESLPTSFEKKLEFASFFGWCDSIYKLNRVDARETNIFRINPGYSNLSTLLSVSSDFSSSPSLLYSKLIRIFILMEFFLSLFFYRLMYVRNLCCISVVRRMLLYL